MKKVNILAVIIKILVYFVLFGVGCSATLGIAFALAFGYGVPEIWAYVLGGAIVFGTMAFIGLSDYKRQIRNKQK